MPIYRRRRGHPYGFTAAFNDAAEYYTDDAFSNRYYFDDAFTMPYVASD